MIGMTHVMDNLKDNIWHSQVVRKDAQVLSRQTVMRLGVITSQNIRRHTAWDITICIDNIEVSVMKHAETEGTQNSSWQPSHITFARSEDTHKPLQRPSNLLARTGNTGLLDTHCPEARTKNKVIKSLQNVGIEGTRYPRRRQLNLQAHIENISVPLTLKTESNMKKQGCHQNRQWWEYGPQVLTPPNQTMKIFGTHSYLKRNSDMIPCFSQETPGVCDTLEPLTSGNNNSIRVSHGVTTS